MQKSNICSYFIIKNTDGKFFHRQFYLIKFCFFSMRFQLKKPYKSLQRKAIKHITIGSDEGDFKAANTHSPIKTTSFAA